MRTKHKQLSMHNSLLCRVAKGGHTPDCVGVVHDAGPLLVLAKRPRVADHLQGSNAPCP